MLRFLIIGALALALGLAAADIAIAKDKGKSGKAKQHNSTSILHSGKGNNGKAKGPKSIPPGQIKRYTRGAKLPIDLKWDDIGDLSKWKLPAPGKGNKYIRLDNEILEVSKDTQTVIDAVGIVGDLLK